MPDKLPHEVICLLDRLDNVMQLEVLLALRDARAAVDPNELTRTIGGSVDHVADALEGLERSGLAGRAQTDHGGRFTYSPGGAEPTVAQLAGLYSTHRVRIVAHVARRAGD